MRKTSHVIHRQAEGKENTQNCTTTRIGKNVYWNETEQNMEANKVNCEQLCGRRWHDAKVSGHYSTGWVNIQGRKTSCRGECWCHKEFYTNMQKKNYIIERTPADPYLCAQFSQAQSQIIWYFCDKSKLIQVVKFHLVWLLQI